jgi:hypothetical protein
VNRRNVRAVLLGASLVVVGAVSASAGQAAAGPDRPLTGRYCVSCHNQRVRTAGLALDTLDINNVAGGAEIWERVIRKLRSGAMPPPGRARPDNAAVDAFLSQLETSLDRLAASHPNPGRTEALHRLTRTEYRNAVRDLFGLDVNVEELLPDDQADAQGFENMAGVLSVSPVLLDRYLTAARKVTRLALAIPPASPETETYRVPLNLIQDHRVSDDLPFGSVGGTVARHYFPIDGEYLIKVKLQTNYVDYIRGLDEPHRLEILLDGASVRQFVVGGEAKGTPAPISYAGTIPGDPDWEHYMHEADAGLEVRVNVKAGPRNVGVAFIAERWEPEGILQPRQVGFALAVNERPDENPAVDSVIITGPLKITGPPDTPSLRKVLVCRPRHQAEEDACARKILGTFARRAFRRPQTDGDVNTLLEFYHLGRAERAGGFEVGIQRALERLLVDPEYLFRIERDPKNLAPGSAYRITDLELASRLSFFLWSSIPDDELLEAAVRGKLRDAATVEQQVRRMLADDRSQALVDNFAGRWLRFRDVASVHPDAGAFPEFDDGLRLAFEKETELFIASVLREDRSVADLLNADYTFVNEQLARHYGIRGVYGARFRRVTITDPARRGLLGHGSVLTVTSYPTRTSPVLRGKFLLENILGTPPPPPPADVMASLPERSADGAPVTVRERLEQHRRNPACAGCHAIMDPLGFALESFDAVGKIRTEEAVQADAIGTFRFGDPAPVIDASGVMPDGTRLEGPAGLRQVLWDRRKQFVATLTERLLSYATGRGLEYYDQPVVRSIVRDTERSDYRWSSIVLAVVRSAPFQMRRGPS